MALSDKNILITPSVGAATDPTIRFVGADASSSATITLRVLNTGTVGTLSFEGSSGQLFSLSDTMVGTIFSVNDVSGIPSIEVLDTGEIRMAQYGGFVDILSTINATTTNSGALQVVGGVGIGGNLYVGGTINGTIVGSITGIATTATNIAGGTAGQVHYQTAPGLTGFYGPGTAGQILLSAGAAAPVYTNTASIFVGAATSAVNLFGGTTGQLHYQSAAGVTAFAGPGTAGQLLVSAGAAAPVYTNTASIYVGAATSAVNLFGGTAGQIHYQSTAGATAFAGPGTAGQLLVSAGAAAPVYTNTASIYVQDSNVSTNIRAGLAGQIHYQSAPNTTAFVSSGTSGQFLQATTNGAPAWTNTGSMYVNRATIADTANSIIGTVTTATNIAGGTAGQLHYQSAPNTTAFAGPGTAGQLLVSAGAAAPVYTNTASIFVGAASSSVNLFGGTTGQFAYQTSAGVTAFISTGSMYVNRATTADNASGSSAQVNTTAQPANATYYPTFVDANNASAAAESVFTTSSFVINPGTGFIGLGTTAQLNPGFTNRLNVNGAIVAGDASSTNGSTILQGYYGTGATTVIGTNRSSGGALIGYGVTPSVTTSNNFLSSTGISLTRSATILDDSIRWYTAPATTTAIGGVVVLTERMRITNAGGVSFGASGTAVGSAGQLLQSNGDAAPTWVNASGLSSGQVNTVAQPGNATYYPAFVDSNNASSTAESLFTTSTFFVNPGTKVVGIGSSTVYTTFGYNSSYGYMIYNGVGTSFHYFSGAGLVSNSVFIGESNVYARGNLGNDAGLVLTVTGGTTTKTYINGILTVGSTATTSGEKLAVAGGVYVNGTVTATTFVGAFSGSITGAATQVNTIAQPGNATYFPTFVDSNNASSSGELVYTTSSFAINPATGASMFGAGPGFVNSYGTANNTYKLIAHNIATTSSAVDDVIRVVSKYNASSGASAFAGQGVSIVFAGGIGDNQTRDRARLVAVYEGSNMSGMAIHTQSSADTVVERMRITSSNSTVPGTVLIATTVTTNANGILQVNGSIGMAPNSQVRQWANSDGGTLQFFGTQFVAGPTNSVSYSYAESGLIASVSNGDSQILLDSGRANTFASGSARFRVENRAGVHSSIQLGRGTTSTFYADTTNAFVGIGYTAQQSGAALSVNGGTFINGTLTATNFVGSFSGSVTGPSTQVNTVAQTANATYYPTFVDSNNASAAAESLFTTSTLSINPGTGVISLNSTIVGGLYTSPTQTLSLSLGTDSWVKLCTLDNRCSAKIQIGTGSNNSEEEAEIEIIATYYVAETLINIKQQSYNNHLREVRVTQTSGGAPKVVYVRIRTTDFAPNINWRLFNTRGFNTLHNIIETPSAGESVLVPASNPSNNIITNATTIVTDNSQASSTSTGALQIAGGAGIGRDLYVGGSVYTAGAKILPTAIQEFTATGGQTTFTVTGGYTVGTIQVFANGIQLANADFTASNGTTVVVATPRISGDIIRTVAGLTSSSINNINALAIAYSVAFGA